ncbi:hypothetical protein KIPE111705_37190 [Kibdelosporangium persicum]|uniref:Uncharacterized protein n=1 Tax=Kibdelosporangium persicum TaxID=2698649 RepID=A0ABX2F5U9_9PSEU|nr:hypothetical protein [Kibdelosporangium persicum]NRN66744.1 hypothetical protein [Kibdelosporangium persicum]
MSAEAALSAMRDAVALWQVGQSSAADVIYAACGLLTADVDTPTLRTLAALSIKDADYEVNELIEAAMSEIGLAWHPRDTSAAKEAALVALARRVLSGGMKPADLAFWAHSAFCHGTSDLAETLVELDDVYGTLDCMHLAVADVDAQVIAEARRITSLS